MVPGRLMPFRLLFPCVPWSRGTNNITLNPIVVGLFDSTILVGGGQKSPPYLTLYW